MKKLITPILVLTMLAFSFNLVSAQGTQMQNKVQDPATHEVTSTPQGNKVENQNETQIQNQGEEQQLMVATQQMQQLTNMEGLGEEISQKVRNIAQEQQQAQVQIQTQIEKLESKSGLIKRLFGPDYEAIKNLKQLTDENQQRIQELQKSAIQVQNEEEVTQLQEAISALVQQNEVLQDKIQAEEGVASIFGWLISLFN